MTRRELAGLAAGLLIAGAGAAAGAQGLPTCRVRVVRSAAADAAPSAVVKQVERWVDARARGSMLVASIDDADVLLELNAYRPLTTTDGTLADEWRFVARRLSEPVRAKATYRFGYVTWPSHETREHVAKELPTVLSDVCLGYLPKVAVGSSRE